ncbi:MAG: hypothetical protein BGO59_10230 [Spirosoma sp. 48-14]|nr:MAG: hypothetical protein BGO59_10230 [Spirosoma sp. 48-14]
MIASVLLVFIIGKANAQNNFSFVNSNVFTGNRAGYQNTTGSVNVFIGNAAGFSNSSGSANLFLGQRAGYGNSTGAYNTFIGSSSGESNTVGANNNFIGNGAGLANTEGNFNVFIGSEAGSKNKRGGSNVHIGSYAGKENLDGSANTFIGHNAGVPVGVTLNNVTVLGYNAVATASNSVILGYSANVGIGTSAPANKLEITQGTNGNSGLRFTNLTSANIPVISTNQFLTVNANGDIVLALVGGSKGAFRQASIDSLEVNSWQLENDGNLKNTNERGIIIGDGIDKKPVGYKLYVAEGILTEKVKVAVKSTSNWSDKVFEKGYHLRNLSEVEQYINQRKHLPGVPSAKEMVLSGNNLHETDAILLEKIEELTLYSIQLQKINNDLQKQIIKIKHKQNKQLQELQLLKNKLK